MGRGRKKHPAAVKLIEDNRVVTYEANAIARAQAYVDAVVSGEVLAGPGVRGAVERHIRDVENQGTDDFPYVLSPTNADWVIKTFETQYKLIGSSYGKPFILHPWQVFVLVSIFGWIDTRDGFRRYREAYVETGRGSGKSPLAAGIGLYMGIADKEKQADVFVCAKTFEQAKICFGMMADMVRQNKYLKSNTTITSQNDPRNLHFRKKDGRMRRVSNDSKGDSLYGQNPSCVICDELHAHRTPQTLETLKGGIKDRKQPLTLIITNSGTFGDAVAWDKHKLALEIVEGKKQRDTSFSYVCGHDAGDDILNDPSCWVKSNPSYPEYPSVKYLKYEVQAALDGSKAMNSVLRVNFCVWTEDDDSWISANAVERAEVDKLGEDEIVKAPCVIALDLSTKRDLTAAVLAWKLPKDHVAIRAHFFTPKHGIEVRSNKDGFRYDEMAKTNQLTATKGAVVNYNEVGRWIQGQTKKYNVVGIVVDPNHGVADFMDALKEIGVKAYRVDEVCAKSHRKQPGLPIYNHNQRRVSTGIPKRQRNGLLLTGLKEPLSMGQSIRDFEVHMQCDTIYIEKNMCLRWNIKSVKIDVGDDYGLFKKKSNTGKIDGAQAAAMAVGFLKVYPAETRRVDKNRGRIRWI